MGEAGFAPVFFEFDFVGGHAPLSVIVFMIDDVVRSGGG